MTDFQETRVVRVFISSTFRDMQDERDELMKKTFPMLRRKAAERDVTLTELDLRWGITPEESESGKVVEICLREIENSVPFFIGIIGNRYGWIPDPCDLGESLRERFSQVDSYVERKLSVTEMEMQFGVLGRKENMHAYFFIKEQETDSVDKPVKLAALKKAVRENDRYPVSTYASPEDLAQQVEEAFTKLLDELFPEGNLSELEKERIGQRAYLNGLCQNYIRTESNFAAIDEWMEDWGKHQLVLTGASGLGKSALVANWVSEKLNAGNKLPYRIIYHFVGNGGSLGSHGHVIKTLCDEIRDRYGFGVDEKEAKTEEKALEELVNKVAAEGDKPLLIVLDAINQIIDVDNSKQLNWLPIPPKNVKILFTTLEEDPTMAVFKNRHYPIFTLQPLTKAQRSDMVEGYLKNYSKKLQPHQVDRIIVDKQCENTLVLKTLLDELVNFGVYEKLDEKIESYLGSDSIEDFYEVLLKGYEEDFGTSFVRHVLSLIAVSRNGLSEEEILSITKATPLHWSQLFCAIRQHLVVKNGLVLFAHGYIRKAVESRYLDEYADWGKTCREAIVSSLRGGRNNRVYNELAFQYNELTDYESLYELVLDFDVFEFFFSSAKNELGDYWRKIRNENQNHTPFNYLSCLSEDKEKHLNNVSSWARSTLSDIHLSKDCAEAALQLAQEKGNKQAMADAYAYIGIVLQDQGAYKDAITLHEKDLDLQMSIHGRVHKFVANALDDLGRAWQQVGEYNRANQYFTESLSIFEELNDYEHVAIMKNNLAILSRLKGNYEIAIDLLRQAININTSLFGERYREIGICYNNLGVVYNVLGNYNLSIECHKQALEIARFQFGEIHADTALAYNNLACSYHESGFLKKALECHKAALGIFLTLYGEENPHTATSYDNLSVLYDALGQKKRGLEYALKSLTIRSRILGDDNAETADSYLNTGAFYVDNHRYVDALDMYERACRIYLKLNGEDNEDLATTYANMGSCFLETGELEKAVEYTRKGLEIRVRLFGYKNKYTIQSLSNLAYAYENQDIYKSIELYQKALSFQLETYGEKTAQSRDLYDNLKYCYGELNDKENRLKCALKAYEINKELETPGINYAYQVADSYEVQRRYEEAIPYYKEAINDYTFGDNEYYKCLYYWASAEEKIGHHEKALEMYLKAISEAGKSSDLHQAARAYEELGYFHLNHGFDSASLDAFNQALNTCPDHDKKPEIRRLSGVLLRNMGRYDEAIASCNEAMILFRQCGNDRKLSHCYVTQGLSYQAKQDIEKAREWFTKALNLRRRILPAGDDAIVECEKYLEELDKTGQP